jgi:hypothetical protein
MLSLVGNAQNMLIQLFASRWGCCVAQRTYSSPPQSAGSGRGCRDQEERGAQQQMVSATAAQVTSYRNKQHVLLPYMKVWRDGCAAQQL